MQTKVSRSKLLIIEDDHEVREQMKWAFEGDYEVLEAEDRSTGLSLFRLSRPSLVTLDLGLPPHQDCATEGLQTLEEILAIDPMVKVVVVTGDSDRAHALKAVQVGAYDYVQKPVQVDVLKVILARACYLAHLERENRTLSDQVDENRFEEIVGSSPAMNKIFDTITRVGDSDIPVLILGESGTGKELVARALHNQKSDRKGPFVPINCSAIPETLLETELFGHEKGSFTGAHAQRKGKVELADGGTLFLDEIGELPQSLQAKLLRYLQEHEFERVGGRERIKVNTRVVAATNLDIEKAIVAGRFREDLYYRLCGVCVKLPPLRERACDIAILAASFMKRYAAAGKTKISGFTKPALKAMEAHRWTGNVRELENRVRRAVVFAEGRLITPEDLDLAMIPDQNIGHTLKAAREMVERSMVESALTRHQGNVSRVAQEMGITRPTLYEMMAKLNIDRVPRDKGAA